MNAEVWSHKIFTYKIEHGTKWLLLFQHYPKNGFFTRQNAAFNLQKGKFSIVNLIGNTHYVKRYNSSFEFLLEYPNEYPNQYNRWIQDINPLDKYDKNATNPETDYKVPGFWPIHLNFTDFGGLLRSHSYSSLLDGKIGEIYWWYAIGDWTGRYSPNTAGPTGTGVSAVYLWIRVSSPYYPTCVNHFTFSLLRRYFLFFSIITFS